MLRTVLVILLSGCVAMVAMVSDGNAQQEQAKKAKRLEAIFKKLDENNDGKLSLEEFRKIVEFHPKLKDKANAISKRFAKLDKDGDGAVSLAEFKLALEQKK